MNLISLAYLTCLETQINFKKVLSGPLGDKFLGMLDAKGMKGLAWFDNGYRNMFNGKKTN